MRTLTGLAIKPWGFSSPRNCEYCSLKIYVRNYIVRLNLHGSAGKSDFAVGESSVENAWVGVSFSGEVDGFVHVEPVVISTSLSIEPLDFYPNKK